MKRAPTRFGAVTPSSGSALFVLAKTSTNNIVFWDGSLVRRLVSKKL